MAALFTRIDLNDEAKCLQFQADQNAVIQRNTRSNRRLGCRGNQPLMNEGVTLEHIVFSRLVSVLGRDLVC